MGGATEHVGRRPGAIGNVPPDIAAYQGTAQVTTATPVADPTRRLTNTYVRPACVHTAGAVKT